MNIRLISIAAAAVLAAGSLCAQENPANEKAKYHKAFTEDFDKEESKYFIQRRDRREEATDFRYFPANTSLSEKGTDVMLYRIARTRIDGVGIFLAVLIIEVAVVARSGKSGIGDFYHGLQFLVY